MKSQYSSKNAKRFNHFSDRFKKKSKKIKRSKLSHNRKSIRFSCKALLSKKIGINMSEYKRGRFVSRSQAIAVSYSQVKKMKPKCSRYFTKK